MAVPTPHAAALAEIPVSEATVEVLGSATRYWIYGPADAAVTLVLVHGYRGDHHGLEPVVARLPGIRIVSPDLPGFGSSTPMTGAPHSVAGYARWLDGFLTALDLRGTAVLLGHSFGSMVASLAVAEGLPTPRLILVNPISTDPRLGGGKVLNALTRGYYGLARRLPDRAGRAMLGNWVIVQGMSMALVKTPDRALRRWIHEEHHRYFSAFSDTATVAEGFDASTSTNVTVNAARIRVPTLIIAGDDDTIAPASGQHLLAELVPDSTLVMIPGVGHLVHYEKAAEAASAIREFVG